MLRGIAWLALGLLLDLVSLTIKLGLLALLIVWLWHLLGYG